MTAFVSLLAIALVVIFSGSSTPAVRMTAQPFAPVPVDAAEVACDRYAAPSGSDRRRQGTERRPFRSVPRLLRALRIGETGCLLPGRYRHDDPARLRSRRASLVGLGGRAKVDGAIWIMGSARGASIRGLDWTASDSEFFIPLKVQADGARIAGNRIRGARSTTCVLIGSTRRTRDVRVERNWIHRCGRRGKLDHAIYIQNAIRTVVRGNVLNANRGGWGVHLYPDADDSLIERNLIDGNLGGVIFAGDDSSSSDRNVVRANAITFSGPRWNIESSWGDDTIGTGNTAYGNCLYSVGPDAPAGIGRLVGFVAGQSLSADSSPYAVRASGQYRFDPASPCAPLVEPLPATFPQP